MDVPALLGAIGFPAGKPSGYVDFEEAASLELPGIAAAWSDGWTVIWHPLAFSRAGDPPPEQNTLWPPTTEQGLVALSNNHEIIGILLEGTSGSYGFVYYANGQRRRCRLAVGSEVAIDFGEPLDQEVAAHKEKGDEEDRLLRFLEAMGVPISSFEDARYMLWATP